MLNTELLIYCLAEIETPKYFQSSPFYLELGGERCGGERCGSNGLMNKDGDENSAVKVEEEGILLDF